MRRFWLTCVFLLAALSSSYAAPKASARKKSKPVVRKITAPAVVKSSATAAEVAKEAPPLAVPLTPVSPSNP